MHLAVCLLGVAASAHHHAILLGALAPILVLGTALLVVLLIGFELRVRNLLLLLLRGPLLGGLLLSKRLLLCHAPA
jgi:hypothetical protein